MGTARRVSPGPLGLLSQLGLLGLLGCGPEVLTLPPLALSTPAQSLLLATEDDDELHLEAYALVPGQALELEPIPSYVGRYPIRLTALFYRESLSSLGLVPGPVLPDPQGQALYLGEFSQRAEVRGNVVDGWTELLALDAPLSEVMIPAPNPTACLDMGGCYTETDGRLEGCRVPCPEPSPLAAPVPAARPVLGPCTHGWRAVTTPDGLEACEPWPEGGRISCASGSAHFPGTPGCAPVGAPCAGDYRASLPAGPVRYVDAAAPAGGDGSLGAPFSTIASAISGAPAGTVIALKKGRYVENVTLRPGLRLIGACAAETVIAPSSGLGIRASVPNAEVHDLTIEGGRSGLECKGSGSQLRASGLVIIDTTNDAVSVDTGGEATIERAHFLRTGGVWLGAGHSTFSQVILERSRGIAVLATTGQTELRDVAILNGQPNPDNSGGRGLSLQGNTTVIADHLLIEDNLDLGVLNTSGHFDFEDLVVRGTRHPVGSNDFGDGLQFSSNSVTRGTRLWNTDNQRFGIMVTGGNADLTLSHAVVTDMVAAANQTAGNALFLQASATASVSRALFARTPGPAVLVTGTPTNLTLVDGTIVETLVAPSDNGSVGGIKVENGGRILGRRLVLRQISGQAVELRDGGSTGDLEDVIIEDTGAGECHACSGVCVTKAAALERLARAAIRGTRGRGVWASGAAAVLRATDLEVSEAVASGTCVNNNPSSSPRFGDGVAAVDGGEVSLQRFWSHDNAAGGLIVEEYLPDQFTSFWARDGRVSDNGTGARLTVGYDVRRLSIGVVYEGNSVPFGY